MKWWNVAVAESNGMFNEARLPPSKTIDSFDFEAVLMVSRAQVIALPPATLTVKETEFLGAALNVSILIDNCGLASYAQREILVLGNGKTRASTSSFVLPVGRSSADCGGVHRRSPTRRRSDLACWVFLMTPQFGAQGSQRAGFPEGILVRVLNGDRHDLS